MLKCVYVFLADPNKNIYTIQKSFFPHNTQSFILVVCNGMQHWHLKKKIQ